MTPLERSRFAADSANGEESPMPLGPLGSAREFINTTQENIRTHHGWSSGIGDCCADCKSMIAVTACQATTTGQLVERTWRKKNSCICVAAILWMGAIGNLVVNYYSPVCTAGMDVNGDGAVNQAELAKGLDANADGLISQDELADKTEDFYDCEQAYYTSGRYAIASLLGSIFVVGLAVLTMLLRRHIRKRDSIPVTVCAGLDDCVCAVVCLPCVQCQLMRHEGMVGDQYRLVSPDGANSFSPSGSMV